MTREEIRATLWPDGTYVDFERGINTCIRQIRAVLNDDAATPRYIETLSRSGYRFISSVRTIDLTEGRTDHTSPAKLGVAPGPLHQVGGFRIGRALATFSVAAVSFALWWINPLPPPRLTTLSRVTAGGQIEAPVKPVSAGRRVYYVERAGGYGKLMETWKGEGDGRSVSSPGHGSVVMDASSDGLELLMASSEEPGEPNQLWMMPTAGSAPRALGVPRVADAAFSPSGKRVAYIQDNTLWITNATGAHARQIAALPDGASWLAWSPDRRQFRFTVGPLLTGASTSLWEISADGKNLRPLLPGWSDPSSECCGSWTHDGRYFIFTSSHSGRPNLWALRDRGSLWRRSPRGPFELTSGPDTPWGGTPSRDGDDIFFYNGVWLQDMQRFDLATGKFSPFRPAGYSVPATFSRDGNWIAYNGPLTGDLFTSRADGTDRVELAPASLDPSFPRWSPDGKWIAFGGNFKGQPSKTYIVPAAGGEPQPLLQGGGEIRDADWSSDGKSLVVSSTAGPQPQAGKDAAASKSETLPCLLIVNFASLRTWKIPGSDGLAMCRWSPNGHYISATWVAASRHELRLWNMTTERWRVITQGRALGISVWSPDSRYLYFQDLVAPGEPLRRYDIQRRLIQPVADFSSALLSGTGRCALFGITPDGSPVVGFSRSFYNLFSADAILP